MTVDSAEADSDAATDRDAGRRPIRRALLSVSDKTGLIELAAALDAAGVDAGVHRRLGPGDRRRGAARSRRSRRSPGFPSAWTAG